MKTLTSKEIAQVVRISQPLKNARLTQGFGPGSGRTQNWYKSFGWLGHNGMDFGVPKGTPVYAVFPGKVVSTYTSSGGGKTILYESDWMTHKGVEFKLRFFYGHLWVKRPFNVKPGDRVDAGEVIGWSGNSGYYSTGAHLHFQVMPYYRIDGKMVRRDSGNGYDGATDPKPLFIDVNFRNAPVSKQYGRRRNWVLEYTFRFAATPLGATLTPFLAQRIKAAQHVHRTLKARGRSNPLLTDNEANALIYGSWDLETVLNPAQFPIWGWNTKSEAAEKKAKGESLKPPGF